MNHLVRITIDDDGEPVFIGPEWCLVDMGNPEGPATLCKGEFFGIGESNCIYTEKWLIRGGITCQNCIDKIKLYKAVKL